MDPVTAIGVASTAYSAIVKGFQMGREVESMAGDLGRWMGAINSVKNGHEKAKKRKFGSIEEEALETFAAKKKAEKMEEELRQFIQWNYGVNAWQEVLRIQGQIRVEKQKEEERRKKQIEDFVVVSAGILGIVILSGIIIYIVWVAKNGA